MTDSQDPKKELSVWAKVILGCAATAAANIFASGKQIGTFEENMRWLAKRLDENFAYHEVLQASHQLADDKEFQRIDRLETRLRDVEVALARNSK